MALERILAMTALGHRPVAKKCHREERKEPPTSFIPHDLQERGERYLYSSPVPTRVSETEIVLLSVRLILCCNYSAQACCFVTQLISLETGPSDRRLPGEPLFSA